MGMDHGGKKLADMAGKAQLYTLHNALNSCLSKEDSISHLSILGDSLYRTLAEKVRIKGWFEIWEDQLTIV